MGQVLSASELQEYAKKQRNKSKAKDAKSKVVISTTDKLNRRFGEDDRTFTEKYGQVRKAVNAASYICQFASVGGAFYAGIKAAYAPTPVGIFAVGVCLVFFFAFEALQRYTSDSFWDSFAAGNSSIKYGFLNLVIFLCGAAMTVGGFYFAANDSHTTQHIADGSTISNQIASIQSQKKALFKDYAIVDNKKEVIQWSKRREYNGKKNGLDDQLATLNAQLATANATDIEYNNVVRNTRKYGFLVVSFIMMVLFEVCMWYRSYYDYMEYLELQSAGVKMTRRKAPSSGKATGLAVAV